MGIGSRKFFWLKPGTTHTLKVRAFAGLSKSEWSEITVTTSGFQGMTWANWKKVKARPVFWNRTIVITWEAIAEPLRMDFYRLFRKQDNTADGSDPPSQASIDDYTTDNPYWLEDTGRKTRRVDHILGQNPDILKEKYYWYWVWAFDKAGNPSAHWLGGSGPSTTPDSAYFGKPNVPAIEEVEYEHQRIIRYLADATVRWKVSGEAEGYWLQRKMNASALWGPMVWVDHDESLSLQEATMGNYITGVKYDWRVKAVNVPVALVSDWSATYTEKIPYDDEEPEEILGCNARRLYVGGFKKGERIRVRWKRPALAVLQQQIEQYEIFRKVGTEAQATAYMATILNGTAQAYDGMVQWQGTQFTDDNVQPLDVAIANFTWNGDYNNGATDQDRRTAEISGGTLVGTLNGGATITTDNPYDNSYSLKILASTLNYLSFTNSNIFSSSEGYIGFYWYPTSLGFGVTDLFRAYKDANNYLNIYYFSARVYIDWMADGVLEQFQLCSPSHPVINTAWSFLELRWKVSTNTLECRKNNGGFGDDGETWRDLSPTALAQFTSEPATVTLGPVASSDNFVNYFDKVSSWGFDGPSATQYYHYWVRSRDVAGLKSTVSMNSGKSYDRVSFEPPPAPTGLDIVQNFIDRLIWTRVTMLITWNAEPEAVWYRVALRTKRPGGSTFGPWLKSPFLDEARITEIDDDDPLGVPKYTVPFAVPKDTTVEYKVSAANVAGENWSSIQTEIVNKDDTPPSPITTLTGECYGWWLFGLKLWVNVWLKWDDHPWYEGISNYEVYYYYAGDWVSRGHVKPTWIDGKKTHFWIPALPGLGGSYKFKVVATDGDGNTSDSNIVEVPWQAWFDWTKRGGS